MKRHAFADPIGQGPAVVELWPETAGDMRELDALVWLGLVGSSASLAGPYPHAPNGRVTAEGRRARLAGIGWHSYVTAVLRGPGALDHVVRLRAHHLLASARWRYLREGPRTIQRGVAWLAGCAWPPVRRKARGVPRLAGLPLTRSR